MDEFAHILHLCQGMYWKSHPDTCHSLHMLMYWNSLGEANVQYQPILFQFVRTSLYSKTETRICFALLSLSSSPPLDTSHFPSANVNNYRALFTEEDGKSLRQCNWYWTFQDFFRSFWSPLRFWVENKNKNVTNFEGSEIQQKWNVGLSKTAITCNCQKQKWVQFWLCKL